jgi:hypothetical protein
VEASVGASSGVGPRGRSFQLTCPIRTLALETGQTIQHAPMPTALTSRPRLVRFTDGLRRALRIKDKEQARPTNSRAREYPHGCAGVFTTQAHSIVRPDTTRTIAQTTRRRKGSSSTRTSSRRACLQTTQSMPSICALVPRALTECTATYPDSTRRYSGARGPVAARLMAI